VTGDSASIAVRLARVEARLQIDQLPIRYALAVDQRNLDELVHLFVPDVSAGRRGTGRNALREWYQEVLGGFYRSVHQICGHRVVLAPLGGPGAADTAAGQVYCRAEHEVRDRWIVMAIRYDDVYRRVGEQWLFERRREYHWYKADVTERPPEVDFEGWREAPGAPGLPHHDPSWSSYWSGRELGAITSHP
jgi:hypothetical protein